MEGLADAPGLRQLLLPRAARQRPTCSAPARRPCSRPRPPAGSTQPFSFDVFGDWGLVDASGNNPDQQNLIAHARGERRPLRGHDRRQRLPVRQPDELRRPPADRRRDERDLRRALLDRARRLRPAVHGRRQPRPQRHGRTPTSPTGRRIVAVSTSGGRYQNDVYCCVNGTTSANYASAWYAFNAGTARFYVLDVGLGRHQPRHRERLRERLRRALRAGHARVQWLLDDLQSHPSGLKFAFLHYPLYSDNKSQSSDTFLQGRAQLEGLLATVRRQHRVQRPRAHLRAQPAERARVPVHLRHRRRRRRRSSRSARAARSTPTGSAGRRRSSRAPVRRRAGARPRRRRSSTSSR